MSLDLCARQCPNCNVTTLTEVFEVMGILFWAVVVSYSLLYAGDGALQSHLLRFLRWCLVGKQTFTPVQKESTDQREGGLKSFKRTEGDTSKRECTSGEKRPAVEVKVSGAVDCRIGDHANAHDMRLRTVAGFHHGVRHLAVVMDGNRRYGRLTAMGAEQPDALESVFHDALLRSGPQAKPVSVRPRLQMLLHGTRLDGHRVGGEKLLEFIIDCLELNVRMVTVYAFSTENWSRSATEVNVLMTLFYCYIDRLSQVAREKGIFIRFISPAFDRILPSIQKLMLEVENETRRHCPRRIVVNVCISYSGRDEIVNAFNRLAQRADKTAPITNDDIMREMLRSITQSEHETEDASILVDNGGVEPQLLLRTGGEVRLSNFLLYECAYTEFVFINKMWPEITREDLQKALRDYSMREKRLGR
ncbi:cis-prenyltransferase-like protein [Trypanosoma vivax]|nr:cis-prenyltransferase-like protein [Trypanosoma vivax]